MAVCIAAISGGVDSVVLLHMLSQGRDEIIVAHADHGIRDDSAADARFVRALAASYGYPYEEAQLQLGPSASEQQAREARYEFLFDVARPSGGVVITAHHGDDLLETVAINLARGTGWRGLAVLNRPGIERPLLGYSKADLYNYALKHQLEWVEDKTNHDMRYLRNKIRASLGARVPKKERLKLLDLRNQQVGLARQILAEQQPFLTQNLFTRHLLNQVNNEVAVELLGTYIEQQTGTRPTRPQLERALIAVKTAKPRTIHHVGAHVQLVFSTRALSVEVVK